ncbi:MAG: glycosyltransferase family 2 protein, partial [Paramuribaculum sp.]|nr:glycosyltransferase family 2 protein [Paramuribaculum sp.]
MNTAPLITIVLPVRNRAQLLPRTLRSIASQTLRPLKVIAVDNGSTDSTAEILGKWAQDVAPAGIEVTIVSEEKPGASAARNRGLAEVTTPYVMLFDSDDEMLPGHTQRLAECIAANPDAEIIGFDIAIRDDDGWTDIKSVNDSDLLRGHILHGSFSTQRYVAKTDFVRAAGGWDEELPRWNDLELGTRLLASAQNPMIFHGDAGVIVHPSADSISCSGFAKDAEILGKVLDKMESVFVSSSKEEDLVWADARSMILDAHCRR